MTLETVLYDARDGIAHIRLNRPHRLNAMVPQLMRDLHEALQAAASDPSVRIVILSGEGRAFCAGDDLKESAQGHGGVAEIRAFVNEIQQVTVDMKSMPKPIIGAVHGYAVGGGCELALDCDLVVAAEDAKFAFTETGVGLFCTGGVTHFLPRTVGLARAKELIMTGEFFDGREAARLGLVNRAVPGDRGAARGRGAGAHDHGEGADPHRHGQERAGVGGPERPHDRDGPRDRVDRRLLPDRGRPGGRASVRREAAASVPRALKSADGARLTDGGTRR